MSDGCMDCRRGIEGLNDELLTRGFAMNEEGGILKASCLHHLQQAVSEEIEQRVGIWLDSCS